MVSVYGKFKDVAFDFINVASDRKKAEALKELLIKENQPWKTNLVDIDGKFDVWHTYDNNAAGMIILIYGNENIIVVIPTTESLIEILRSLDWKFISGFRFSFTCNFSVKQFQDKTTNVW